MTNKLIEGPSWPDMLEGLDPDQQYEIVVDPTKQLEGDRLSFDVWIKPVAPFEIQCETIVAKSRQLSATWTVEHTETIAIEPSDEVVQELTNALIDHISGSDVDEPTQTLMEFAIDFLTNANAIVAEAHEAETKGTEDEYWASDEVKHFRQKLAEALGVESYADLTQEMVKEELAKPYVPSYVPSQEMKDEAAISMMNWLSANVEDFKKKPKPIAVPTIQRGVQIDTTLPVEEIGAEKIDKGT